MRSSRQGLVFFIIILVIGFSIGSHIITACFFGTLSLVGLIALVESIKPLRWLLQRSSKVFDAIVFVFTIIATMRYGLTIAASLTVMGLGYTLVYGPYLREQLSSVKRKKNSNRRDSFDFS